MAPFRAANLRLPFFALLAFVLCAAPLSASAAWSADEDGSYREGFTLELTLGVGYQMYTPDKGDGEKTIGLSGLNLGIGGFLNEDMAVLFRFSGTNVTHDINGADMNTVCGVGGPAIQYWLSDALKIEAGPGFAVIRATVETALGTIEGDDEGWGGIVALAYNLWHNDNHSLQIGAEYAPAWFDKSMVHNMGVTFGWQLL